MTDTMAPAGAAPAGAAPARGKQGAQAPVVVRPFIAGSRRTDEPDYDQTLTLTAAEQRLPSYQISPNGYLRGIQILVQATVAGNAAVVTYNEDGPFNVLANVNLQDTNSQPIVGPMTGYDLYILNKYGGYAFQDDAKVSHPYNQGVGAGATTGGAFTFVLWVPVEIVARDALGAQPNKSGASQFSLVLSYAASATVYGVAPTNAASVRTRCTLSGWQDPDSNDSRGNPTAQDPPAVQTSQYWHKQIYNGLAGAVNRRLEGIDGLVRNLIFVNYRSASTRVLGAADFPDPFTLKYENSLIIESRIKALWLHMISRNYGYSAAEVAGTNVPNAVDNGVFPVDFMNDYAQKPGWESRFQYLPMSSASNLEIQGTFASTNNLVVLVNKIVPFPQGNVRGLTGGR
jgi:hypothetical protein